MPVVLRPIELPADYERMAELLNSFYSETQTVQTLHEREQHTPPGTVRSRMAASDEQGRMLGFADCLRAPFMLRDSFALELVVDPARRRLGIGTLLYAHANSFARAQQATRLEVEVRDDKPGWRRFAEGECFAVDRHIFESRLDLVTFDEGRFAGIPEGVGFPPTPRQCCGREARCPEGVAASGVRFFTMADVDSSEANLQQHYELIKRNALDIPGNEGTFPAFENYRQLVYTASWYRPAGQIIAAVGEVWVGIAGTAYFQATNSTYTMHTGVLRAYRGQNIALALKLLGIRWSKQIGVPYMRTHNDSQNTPILGINQKLGYQPQPGYFRMLKVLGAGR